MSTCLAGVLLLCCAGILAAQSAEADAPEGAAEVVGERPYEMDWASRTEDDHAPLVDFEALDGWTVETTDSEATFQRTREQQLWGKYVARLTYRAIGNSPTVTARPPNPISIADPFDAVTCWIYGNNWAWQPDPTTPQVTISALFLDSKGDEFAVPFERVRWKEWFLCHRRLTPEQIDRAANGARFSGFTITGGRNTEDRVLFFDNLAVFVEKLAPLRFEPRPERGIPMFPDQGTATNSGPGRLPFPTRPETILPANLTTQFDTSLAQVGDAFALTYDGPDGTLQYRITPKTGTLTDIKARWESRGGTIQPCTDGGILFDTEEGPTAPDTSEHLGTNREADTVISCWQMHLGDRSTPVTYTYRLWGKSLVIDVMAPGGQVAEVRYGRATGLEDPRLVTLPYYPAGQGRTRPAIAVSGPPDAPLFLMGNTCWYLSNASAPFALNEIKDGEALYNGGTRYIPRTNGERNDCYERLFITISPRFEEVLPTIPNPTSPWKHITGTHVWRAHGASDREADLKRWRECHRYGMTEVVITDHETGWRDGGESFTFRTRTAPKKGGDQGQYDYARAMQDELGFVYGPYNNYTDFAPVNEFWDVDRVNRTPDNQLQRAWARCYAPKPARAVEFCGLLAPQIEAKFHFSTAYCDVHTAVAPWDRVDYDSRVPGAGTFAGVFYPYGEIMLLQKAAWDGPVYSEGNNHAFYCGLTDGNYGQDQRYGPAVNPWLVDFDLRKMHDLCCNFGMGNLGMFYGRNYDLGQTRAEVDKSIDRFLAATVAFGHPGFLVYEGGLHNALRSYYMLQQLASQYCLSSVDEIRYLNADGDLLDTSSAVASGAFERSQIVCRYKNGCVTVANGHASERMVLQAYGRSLDLPPNGYAGWTPDGSIDVLSSDPDGHRCDYAETPAYLYVDGRGEFARFDRGAGNGIGICRKLAEGSHEVILYEDTDAGFAIGPASAVALDRDRNELGPADVRIARGLTYVVPIEGAFSYILTPASMSAAGLTCARDAVVAGEQVAVLGKSRHEAQIPPNAQPGDRIWLEFEGAWIDFTVVPLTNANVSLEGNTLHVALENNLHRPSDGVVLVSDQKQLVDFVPDEPALAAFDLGQPTGESSDVLRVEIRSGDFSQLIERALVTTRGFRHVADLPDEYRAGMRVRGEDESFDFRDTRARVQPARATCGRETRDALDMHPPYVGGVGYAFALYEPVELPDTPAAFRASVGKKDGSDPGDGILYRVGILDADGRETIAGETLVTAHEWLPIEADLTAWAGQRIAIKLISDVGRADNSSGDWACWADMRIESLEPLLTRRLEPNTERYCREAGPFALEGLAVSDVRQARRGGLHYDGMGLSGVGEYGSYAVINDIDLGPMAPAGGSEAAGVWAEGVSVPLTPECIRALGQRNTFSLRNPRGDFFKVRRFWIELELADGRKCSSDISMATFTQPPSWTYAEGIGVPHGQDIQLDIWFPAEDGF